MFRWIKHRIKYLWMRLTIPTVEVKVEDDGRVPLWRAVMAADPDISTPEGARGAINLGRVKIVWVMPGWSESMADTVTFPHAHDGSDWVTRIGSGVPYLLYVGKDRAWIKHIQ